MPARPALDDGSDRDGVTGGVRRSGDATGGDGERSRGSEAETLDRRLRERAVAVARRELTTAFDCDGMADLGPAQRRVVTAMAGRIAAGVLAPARAAADMEGDGPSPEAIARLFAPDEQVRDER